MKFPRLRYILDIDKVRKVRLIDFIRAIWYYYIRPKEKVKRAIKRYNVCLSCEHLSNNIDDCAIKSKYSTPCCAYCGCSLSIKLYSDQGCDLKKW